MKTLSTAIAIALCFLGSPGLAQKSYPCELAYLQISDLEKDSTLWSHNPVKGNQTSRTTFDFFMFKKFQGSKEPFFGLRMQAIARKASDNKSVNCILSDGKLYSFTNIDCTYVSAGSYYLYTALIVLTREEAQMLKSKYIRKYRINGVAQEGITTKSAGTFYPSMAECIYR